MTQVKQRRKVSIEKLVGKDGSLVAYETDFQFLEKRDGAREVFDQNRKEPGRVSRDRQGFEPTDVRNCEKERFLPRERVADLFERDLQGG
jgi:hypothetical protein